MGRAYLTFWKKWSSLIHSLKSSLIHSQKSSFSHFPVADSANKLDNHGSRGFGRPKKPRPKSGFTFMDYTIMLVLKGFIDVLFWKITKYGRGCIETHWQPYIVIWLTIGYGGYASRNPILKALTTNIGMY